MLRDAETESAMLGAEDDGVGRERWSRVTVGLRDADDERPHDRGCLAQLVALELCDFEAGRADRFDCWAVAVAAVAESGLEPVQPVLLRLAERVGLDEQRRADVYYVICAEGEMILEGLDYAETWDAVIDAEPALAVMLSWDRFDAALLAIANFDDLKSPYSLGHSRAVADLAAAASAQLGLSQAEARTLRRAGLVHDFGRLGVSNAIGDKPGPLGAGEWERVRLHPYLTEHLLENRRLDARQGEPVRMRCPFAPSFRDSHRRGPCCFERRCWWPSPSALVAVTVGSHGGDDPC